MGEIEVRLQPRSSREEIAGERGGRLLVRVTAPPVDDRANEALRRLIAKCAGVAVSRVQIVWGTKSRDKTVQVDGVGTAELLAALRRPQSSKRA